MKETLNQEQLQQIDNEQQYILKHNIPQLFTELTAKLIQERPDGIREFLSKQIKKIKQKPKQGFFTNQDFELIFENYNSLNLNEVRIACLVQALGSLSINITEDELIHKYSPELKKGQNIRKIKFVQILQDEYLKKFDFTQK